MRRDLPSRVKVMYKDPERRGKNTQGREEDSLARRKRPSQHRRESDHNGPFINRLHFQRSLWQQYLEGGKKEGKKE